MKTVIYKAVVNEEGKVLESGLFVEGKVYGLGIVVRNLYFSIRTRSRHTDEDGNVYYAHHDYDYLVTGRMWQNNKLAMRKFGKFSVEVSDVQKKIDVCFFEQLAMTNVRSIIFDESAFPSEFFKRFREALSFDNLVQVTFSDKMIESSSVVPLDWDAYVQESANEKFNSLQSLVNRFHTINTLDMSQCWFYKDLRKRKERDQSQNKTLHHKHYSTFIPIKSLVKFLLTNQTLQVVTLAQHRKLRQSEAKAIVEGIFDKNTSIIHLTLEFHEEDKQEAAEIKKKMHVFVERNRKLRHEMIHAVGHGDVGRLKAALEAGASPFVLLEDHQNWVHHAPNSLFRSALDLRAAVAEQINRHKKKHHGQYPKSKKDEYLEEMYNERDEIVKLLESAQKTYLGEMKVLNGKEQQEEKKQSTSKGKSEKVSSHSEKLKNTNDEEVKQGL